MPAEIRTEIFQNGDLVTPYDAPEPLRDWVQRHVDALKVLTPASDPLVTTWPIADPPGTGSVSTDRQPRQSDEAFLIAHTLEFQVAMIGDPPDPS